MVRIEKPWIVRRDGTVADRETGEAIGHVYLTDYGWDATLHEPYLHSYMHATRIQAVETIWSARSTGGSRA